MKKFFLFLGLITITSILFIAFDPGASEAKQKNIKPFVFIQYANILPACSISSNDQDGTYKTIGYRLKDGGIDYKFSAGTFPKYLKKQAVENILNISFSNIQSANNGILFHSAGETTIKKEGRDGVNLLAFKSLPANVAAITYLWAENGRINNVDTFFNNKIRWSYVSYNGKNDCSGTRSTYDLQNIATHEFGHWVGLDDLYSTNAKDLTMYGYAAKGELKKDSLGGGDINGIKSNWP